jgi:hypothetical protein
VTRGEQLRESIAKEFDVAGMVAESLVNEVCKTADELSIMEDALIEHGPLIQGGRNQLVANPAAALVVRHRKLLADLLREAFPEHEETATQLARRAARARWNKGA